MLVLDHLTREMEVGWEIKWIGGRGKKKDGGGGGGGSYGKLC